MKRKLTHKFKVKKDQIHQEYIAKMTAKNLIGDAGRFIPHRLSRPCVPNDHHTPCNNIHTNKLDIKMKNLVMVIKDIPSINFS